MIRNELLKFKNVKLKILREKKSTTINYNY